MVTWWNNNDIEIVEIDGELYALNGWNGEKWVHCWKCIDRFTAAEEDAAYEIVPIYDWSKWNKEEEEFQDENGTAIDGLIGYEVL